jgi:hypothetical protein
MRFVVIVSDVFLIDLNGAYSVGHADHPVPFRNTQQLIMHTKVVYKTVHQAQSFHQKHARNGFYGELLPSYGEDGVTSTVNLLFNIVLKTTSLR